MSLRIARRVDAEYFAKKMTGYDYNDNLVQITIKAESEEDAISFALENAEITLTDKVTDLKVISKALDFNKI